LEQFRPIFSKDKDIGVVCKKDKSGVFLGIGKVIDINKEEKRPKTAALRNSIKYR
jgi:hypothetical protein